MAGSTDKRQIWIALGLCLGLACALAWGMLPLLDWAVGDAGIGADDLMSRVENGAWDTLPEGLRLSPFALYLLTRIQDFAFTIAAFVSAALIFGRRGTKDLISGLAPARIAWRWMAVALGLPVLAYGLAITLAAAGEPARLAGADFSAAALGEMLFGPATGLMVYLFLRAGLGEEPGIRGFVLPLLLRLTNPLRAALAIGVIWAFWHGPLLLGRQPLEIGFFVVLNLALSLLFAWLYLRAEGSIWPVALLHAGINAGDRMAERLWPGLQDTDWQLPAYLLLILLGAGLGVVLARPAMKARARALVQE